VWLNPDPRVWELVEAAAKEDWPKVDALRECINAFSPLHETALIVSLGRPVEVLDALLARGADPNVGVRRGNMPLTIACSKGLDKHVRSLLRAGADVTARDDRGHTALAWACYNRKKVCAQMVLKNIWAAGGGVSAEEINAALIGHLSAIAEEMARRSPVA